MRVRGIVRYDKLQHAAEYAKGKEVAAKQYARFVAQSIPGRIDQRVITGAVHDYLCPLSNDKSYLFEMTTGATDTAAENTLFHVISEFISNREIVVPIKTSEYLTEEEMAQISMSVLKNAIIARVRPALCTAASELLRLPSRMTEHNMPDPDFSEVEASILNVVGIEYESLSPQEKEKVQEKYSQSYKIGYDAVPDDLFLDRQSTAYSILQGRLNSYPEAANREFLLRLADADPEAIASLTKESEWNSDSLAYEIYFKLFIDGIENIDNADLGFLNSDMADLVVSSGYADGVEAKVDQLAPPALVSAARQLVDGAA